MSRELFKETFFPLGIDDDTVYRWFTDAHRRWRVFRGDSCKVSNLEMCHVATTRGKDELLYFNDVAEDDVAEEDYKSIFTNVDVMFYDDKFKYGLEDDKESCFSYDGKSAYDDELVLRDDRVDTDGDIVQRRFKSGLEVSYNTPDEYFGPMNKYEQHLYTMLDIHELYYTKNTDYGDAFTQSLDKHGPIAALVRMEDKWNRLSNLMSNGKEGYIKSESVEDTLIDLANYAIMTALYLRGNTTDD